MGVVCYRCPDSGQAVTTAIETGQDTLTRMRDMNLTIWVWCPHCVTGHQIKAGDTTLADAPRAPITSGVSAAAAPSLAAG